MIFRQLANFARHGAVDALALSALSRLDPETAHGLTIKALKFGAVPPAPEDAPQLATRLCGLALKNPVGVAAGFDKNAEVPAALARAGFGMVEVGTVTPRPQAGNPTPRIFRLPRQQGVINRLGFNNLGHEAALRHLERARIPAILGINVGANKDSEDFVADFVLGVRRFAPHADYLTVNVSSPNTPGLRDLQAEEALARLLGAVLEARAGAQRRVPVFLKLAPDLEPKAMDDIARVIEATDLDGLIVSNTTISRPGVQDDPAAAQAGGLSGRPMFNLATTRLAQMRQRVGDMPIIGVGGVHSGASALAKFAAGANAIQLYSALVYSGLGLLDEIKSELRRAAQNAGGIAALSGTDIEGWASGKAEL